MKLELYQGGAFVQVIEYVVPNTGAYAWSVPAGLTPAADYTILIYSRSDLSILDTSDAAFTVAEGEVLVYVDKDNASGTENGQSWATAYVTVQEGIDAAAARGGGEVWVAEGVYGEAVTMRSDVQVYGGFSGSETEREERDPDVYFTTINVGLVE